MSLRIVDLSLRLIPAGCGQARYRPLAIGPALLTRHDADGPWWVQVSADGRLRPVWPPPVGRTPPCAQRQAIALLRPEDIGSEARRASAGAGRRRAADIYGWCLMYQLPGMHGMAIVDAHDEFTDLPAYYELPLELLDRMDHLAGRGIPARPLALMTQPDDFEPAGRGTPRRNRYHPSARCAAPRDLWAWGH